MTNFKPGDKVLVTIPCVIGGDGHLEIKSLESTANHLHGTSGYLLNPAGAERVYGATVTLVTDEPAEPYQPREGDEVEVALRPLKGTVAAAAAGRVWMNGPGRNCLAAESLAEAVAEGRVRLVKAAAPVYELDALYVSSSDPTQLFRYRPSTAPFYANGPFIALFGESFGERILNSDMPTDLVQATVAPAREAS